MPYANAPNTLQSVKGRRYLNSLVRRWNDIWLREGDVLVAEGVEIDADGRASNVQHLAAADIAALLEEEDDAEVTDDAYLAAAET